MRCKVQQWATAGLLALVLLVLARDPAQGAPAARVRGAPPPAPSPAALPVGAPNASHWPPRLDASPCATFLRVYVDFAASVELHFLLSVVLADTRRACGVCVRLLPRAEFAEDLGALSSGGASCAPLLLAANTDLHEYEVAAMREHPAAARERVLVFHLSDEHEDRIIPTDGYALPRLLLRNYYSAARDRLVDLTYLQGGSSGGPVELGSAEAGTAPGAPPARALWVPLGHADAFAAALAPLLAAPTRARPYAWSWAGSRGGKPARAQFLEGLAQQQPASAAAALRASGRLHVFEEFMQAGWALGPLQYSAWLYESRVAPCPPGGSPEQFRVWEALEAGAVPLLPRGARHLAYLPALDLRALWINGSRWREDAAPLLLAAARNASFIAELEAAQAHNARALAGVYARLGARVGAEVCAAAGLACAGAGGGACPRAAAPRAAPCWDAAGAAAAQGREGQA